MELNKILDKLLINNDKNIVGVILSYLDKCSECERYDCITRYFVKNCCISKSCFRSNSMIKWIELDMCYRCMVKKMLNHHSGKNAVLTWKEYHKDYYNP